jgi:hypothetical protein
MAGEDDKLSAEEFAKWIPAPALTPMLNPYLSEAVWRPLILKRISDHDLFTAARKTTYVNRNDEWVEHHQRIGSALWAETTNARPNDHFWLTGDISFHHTEYSQVTAISCVEIRFEPEGVERLKPLGVEPKPPAIRSRVAGTPSAPQSVAAKHAGGRPTKPFWEDALIEMARQLYVGELQPSRQADVLKALQDWLAKNEHEAGDTPAKERARKLWQAINREVGN